MTRDMIHDHGEKPITIENCVIEHSQTHQLFIKLRQGKSQPGKRFGYLVLISIGFDDFSSPFTAQFLFCLRRYINTRVSVSSVYNFQTPRISFKINPLRFIFPTLFSVFGYPSETLSLVSDILLPLPNTTCPCYIEVELQQNFPTQAQNEPIRLCC